MKDKDPVPNNTRVTVTEQPYADDDPVPMSDGVYKAVGLSRPLTFNPDHYATTVRRSA